MQSESFQSKAGNWKIIIDDFMNGPGLQIFLNGQLVDAKSYGNSRHSVLKRQLHFDFLKQEMQKDPNITVSELKNIFRIIDK